jgi:hypothetical protein
VEAPVVLEVAAEITRTLLTAVTVETAAQA